MNHLKQILSLLPPTHPDGHSFVYIFAIVTFLLGIIYEPLGWLGVIATLWCVSFFRDPDRVTPTAKDIVVSPADGIVSAIETVESPRELDLDGKEWVRISIFLSVFDVHINRVPCDGTIEETHYHPGKFLSANLDKASEENERQTILMQTDSKKPLIFVQIAGLVARRIVCELEEGNRVKAGQRFGLIRFGSRMDVYVPSSIYPDVIVGQRVVGGETILVHLDGSTKQNVEGEVR